MLSPHFLLILALLSHGTTAFPTLPGSTAFTKWTRNLNPLSWQISQPRRDSRQGLEKRQAQGDGTAFDRNPDGSSFLWTLEDTYQGKTFFE
jgi:hypothetical protein